MYVNICDISGIDVVQWCYYLEIFQVTVLSCLFCQTCSQSYCHVVDCVGCNVNEQNATGQNAAQKIVQNKLPQK